LQAESDDLEVIGVLVENSNSDVLMVNTCAYRKSNPYVLMVQTSEVRVGHDAANSLNGTARWCILVQR